MNQKVAKQLRKIVFGDYSQRERDYGVIERKIPKRGMRGQLVCRGLRARYLEAKKALKFLRRQGIGLTPSLAAIAAQCTEQNQSRS